MRCASAQCVSGAVEQNINIFAQCNVNKTGNPGWAHIGAGGRTWPTRTDRPFDVKPLG